jgi:hypothetical protein
VGYALVHNHGSNLHAKRHFGDFIDQINLELTPVFFINGKFDIKLDAECMILTNFEVLILFSISPFNADGKPIAFGIIVYVID